MYQRDSPKLIGSGAPKNGQERTVTDRDGVKHLEHFVNGSWRHSAKCRLWTNKECRQ
ncbi:hypothetical protein [Nitrososphaera sp.]|uniref:hypothetical protein n=1 Tax=Nitrososphaera sp. TaxID=1971748 RepID=UPI0017FC935D|nr:hypothetical protein [Nitrososphaera sp.]NWG37509.1 hypothetical protein [Nitrososphaera sp.]